MGNPQPRALETGSRFNDYSKYPTVLTMEKGARMGSNGQLSFEDIV